VDTGQAHVARMLGFKDSCCRESLPINERRLIHVTVQFKTLKHLDLDIVGYMYFSYSRGRCTEQLLSILYKSDDTLVLVFCQALVDTDQAHVNRMLAYKD